MNRTLRIRQWLGVAVVTVALALLGASILANQSHVDTESAAAGLGEKVQERMQLLDGFIQEAAAQDPSEWMRLKGLPEDMVIYRYEADTLQSWAHQFPILNDDIRPKTLVQRLGDTRGSYISPLVQVGKTLSYANYGPKWFLVKSVEAGRSTFIAGLEIANELKASSYNGINPRFRINDRYTIQPISGSIGSPVIVDGIPLFKITSEKMSEPGRHNSPLFWLAVGFFLLGSLLFLSSRPDWLRFGVVLSVQAGLLVWLFLYGLRLGRVSQLFSPLLYADGPFLYSLGAVVIVNLLVTVAVLDCYLMRWTFLKALRERDSRWLQAFLAVVVVALVTGICLYLHTAFKSIVFNSGICLELYKVNLVNLYTAVVYVSFLSLAMTLPLLAQMLSPLLRRLLHIRYDVFSRWGRVCFAVITAGYFVVTSSFLGFRKEQNRVDVWANRLAMDRDISLEIQLRSVENQIATDPVIKALSALDNSHDILRSRLANTFMSRISQDYDISVVILRAHPALDALFNDRIRGGVRLADNSHFFYSTGSNGRARYTGLFSYYNAGYGSSSLMVLVESKSNREDRGYLSLLGITEPGRVAVPPHYSYAKYIGGRLAIYKGEYGYPTVLSDRLSGLLEEHQGGHLVLDGYTHFVLNVAEGEVVVISREETDLLDYAVEGALFAILAYLLITLLTVRIRLRRGGQRQYYRTRISVVLYVSLTLTLVAMAVFSVYFVYRRNNADMQTIMTSRINTLQSMLQGRLRQAEKDADLRTQEVRGAVEDIGNNLKSDITLFTPDGRLVLSTTPEIYDRLVMGHRLNEEAYYSIIHLHNRYCIQKEKTGPRRYYALYAPIFNGSGRMVAIVSSPYTDQSYDFETEALMHIATIITVFLLLLMLSRVVTMEVVGRLLRPLSEMSHKMTVADVDHLEYIDYDQDDEISTLVQSYNLMVRDLSESTRRLAQVERDKAWTDMARRVAHDIKNPLTPIKLKLQMLIRMKQSGNPAWQDKFDEVAATVLEHVDMLADSADQFSTFAKLYDQKPERIDLDALVRQEVFLFDSRPDIDFDYFGLEGAWVTGPKPQLTRVLVNLLTNAIQAVEGEPQRGRIVLSVRNSAREGFYDIVVEDNGPGVKEENRERIFTPDFTTKSSGSGLGLAICHKIVEHCGGEIFYTRSFTLGGACFTVRYPKG